MALLTGQGAQLAFIVKGYPRLSETFIAQEILALEQRGLSLMIVSLRQPTDRARHPMHDQIAAPVLYLAEYLYGAPLRLFKAWRAARKAPGYQDAKRIWLKDLRRDFTANRIRRFGQALVLAHELPPTVSHLHAHFLHTPSSVARYAAHMRGLDWTASAHAVDVWTTPDWELTEKLEDCQWVVTCTSLNQTHLKRLTRDPEKVQLLYHGLDLSHFPKPAPRPQTRDGTDPENPLRLLSVGRLVEKKGYIDLLAALALLPKGLHWRLEHLGDGPLAAELRREAGRLGLAGRIDWRGAQAGSKVMEAYGRADLFVLACCIAANGDRDGLPNVLMEAQAMGLACISTSVSAIPELIEDGQSGILAAPGNPGELAMNLEKLMGDPGLRARLGEGGRARLTRLFSFSDGITKLAARFGAGPDVARVA